jgi:hypothetical protein
LLVGNARTAGSSAPAGVSTVDEDDQTSQSISAPVDPRPLVSHSIGLTVHDLPTASQSIDAADIEMAHPHHLNDRTSPDVTSASAPYSLGRPTNTKHSIGVFPKQYTFPPTNLSPAARTGMFKVDEAFAQLRWKSKIPDVHRKDDHRWSSPWMTGMWELLGQYDPENEVGIPHVFRYLLDAVLDVHTVPLRYVSITTFCVRILWAYKFTNSKAKIFLEPRVDPRSLIYG